MRRNGSILIRMLALVIVLGAIAAFVVFVGIPLYAPQKDEKLAQPIIHYYEGDKQVVKMENDELLFEMDPLTTHFTLTEKATGRKWLSNPADADKDSKAVSANKGVLQSTLLLYYSPESSTDIERNNYQYSIANGNYIIEKTDDGAICVHYSIGEIEKIYMIPYAITADRYKAFVNQMSKKDQKKVGGYFSSYTPSKVEKLEEDARNELTLQYPSITTTDMYVFKSDVPESNKKSCEAMFASVGYTQEDFDLDQTLIAGKKDSEKPIFNVTMEYRLDGGDFLVSVPYENMRYRSGYSITYVTVLPMFGAQGVDKEGFMLVPEGGGALIRYNNGKTKQNSYYADLYGWDYAIKRDEVVSETEALFPVFGMTGNGGSFICIIEEGTAYAGIQADISMRYNSYNYANAKYHVLHADEYNVSAKTAQIVKMFEKQIPNDTIVQRYCFVDTDDYVDMAKAYGDYLIKNNPTLAVANENENLPVSVELVGAIDKTVVKFGAPVESAVPVTTFNQAADMIDAIKNMGADNLSVRITGWNNGGVNQKVLTKVKVLKKLGGESGLKELVQYAKDENVSLYLDGVSTFAYDSGMLRGFVGYRDAARFTTREQVKIYPYSYVTYLPAEWKDPFYLVTPEYAAKMSENLIQAIGEVGGEGVAFRDVGSMLSSNYNPKATVTREEAKDMNIQTLKLAKDGGKKVSIKQGFDFALGYVDLITDMNLTGTNYKLLDESVPFYQIALHGITEYTGQAINISSDLQTELLKCAEYGSGLNFTFMAEKGTIVQETYYSALYGACFFDWQEDVESIISSYQKDMAGINNVRMVDHEILTKDVRATHYENGKTVYVNYSFEDYTDGVTVVPARSYIVTGGEE